jgi:nicotinate-nucleotide pyrophosphorylase (carboxylating)
MSVNIDKIDPEAPFFNFRGYAVSRVRNKWGDRFKIEVECRNLDDVNEALRCNVDIIMLDNMDFESMKEAVKNVKGVVKLEASGDVDTEKVKKLSSLGVDYISVGMITKSVKSFDFSLDIDKKLRDVCPNELNTIF